MQRMLSSYGLLHMSAVLLLQQLPAHATVLPHMVPAQTEEASRVHSLSVEA
jgi:hypothetical protein